MKKIVNGVEVELSAEEAAAILAAWQAAQDAQAAAAPEIARLADIDADIKTDSQSAALKAMSRAEFSTWFDARTTAQKLELLKRISFIVIRRVL